MLLEAGPLKETSQFSLLSESKMNVQSKRDFRSILTHTHTKEEYYLDQLTVICLLPSSIGADCIQNFEKLA